MTDLNSMNATEIYEQNLAEHFERGSSLYKTFANAFEVHCESHEQKDALQRFTNSVTNNIHLLFFKDLLEKEKLQLEFHYISIIEACHDYPAAAKDLEKLCEKRDEERFELINKDASPRTLPENGAYLLSHIDDLMSIIVVDSGKITVHVIEEG